MADTTETGLKNVTTELNQTNKILGSIDDKLAKPSGPSPAEIKEENEDSANTAKKQSMFMKKISGGIGWLVESGKKVGKAAKLSAVAFLSTLAIGGLLIALGNFLQSDTFKKLMKYLKDTIIPKLKEFWEFVKANWEEIAVLIAGIITALAIAKFIELARKVKNAFLAIKTFMLVTMLENVKGMIGGALSKGKQTFTMVANMVKNAFIAVKTFMMTTMLPAIKGMIGGALSKGKQTFTMVANMVKNAFIAVKTFMMTTMLPAIKGMIGGALSKGKQTFTMVATMIKNAFIAVKTFMMTTMLPAIKGMIGSAFSAGKNSFLAVAGFLKNAFIAVKTFMMTTMLPAVTGMIGSAMSAGKNSFVAVAGLIRKGFTAVRTFMLLTMLPAVTAFMAPLLPIIAIAAAVALVLCALYEAFQDFRKTLDKTGSIGEAIKVAIGKFVGVLLGAIPALFLKLVAFVADLFGFKEFAKKIGDIDPIQFIADTAVKFMDKIGKFFGSIFDIDFGALLDQIVPDLVKKSWVGKQLGFSGGGGETVTPEDAKAKRIAELEKKRILIGGPRDAKFGRHRAAERRAEMDAEIARLKSEAAADLAAIGKTKNVRQRLTEAKKLGMTPAKFKENAAIIEKMAQAKQQAELARQQIATAAPNIITDARQSSSVTTTGQTGNSSLVSTKFGNLNKAEAWGF
tara:strand:+ start:129 stop:2174 length:2046 start_codon:yes stop_codon:yes gene_type:complete